MQDTCQGGPEWHWWRNEFLKESCFGSWTTDAWVTSYWEKRKAMNNFPMILDRNYKCSWFVMIGHFILKVHTCRSIFVTQQSSDVVETRQRRPPAASPVRPRPPLQPSWIFKHFTLLCSAIACNCHQLWQPAAVSSVRLLFFPGRVKKVVVINKTWYTTITTHESSALFPLVSTTN